MFWHYYAGPLGWPALNQCKPTNLDQQRNSFTLFLKAECTEVQCMKIHATIKGFALFYIPVFHRVVFGNSNGLAVVDYLQKTVLLNLGTMELYGSNDPYQRQLRSPRKSRQPSGGLICTQTWFSSIIDKSTKSYIYTNHWQDMQQCTERDTAMWPLLVECTIADDSKKEMIAGTWQWTGC